MVPLDGLRRRQGPRDLPLERPANLFRGRHRIRHGKVQPRFRPSRLCLGGGPPRDRRPGAQCGHGDGLRPGGRGDPAHRLGALRAGRPRDLHVQTVRGVHHPRRAARRGRRRCGPLVLRVTRAHDRDRLRHRAGQEAVERESRLLRAVRPCANRLDPAKGERNRAVVSRFGRGRTVGRAGGGSRPSRGPPTRRRRGRSGGKRDPGHHRICDRAGNHLPRLLPRCPGSRP